MLLHNTLTLEWSILHQAGFAKLPCRRDEERPDALRATAAPVSDVRQLDLAPRGFRTEVGGLFLFVVRGRPRPLSTSAPRGRPPDLLERNLSEGPTHDTTLRQARTSPSGNTAKNP